MTFRARHINMWICSSCLLLVLVAGACSYKTTSFNNKYNYNNKYKYKHGKYNVVASVHLESISVELQVPQNSSDSEDINPLQQLQQADDSSLRVPPPSQTANQVRPQQEPANQNAGLETKVKVKGKDKGKGKGKGKGKDKDKNKESKAKSQNEANDEGHFSTYTKLYHHYLKRHKPWLLLPNDRMCLKERCTGDSDCCRKYNICDKSADVCIDCWKGYLCKTGADCCERFPTCVYDRDFKDQSHGYCDNDL